MTARSARVALVLVSHSRSLAEGLAEVAGQMAPDVALLPAGGTADGGLGTGFDRVLAAVETGVADGRSVAVLTDLGSAVLTAESVLEAIDPDDADRVRVAAGPFVEGAVEAAVVAQGGGDLDAVVEAVRSAGVALVGDGTGDGHGGGPSAAAPDPSAEIRESQDEPVARGTAVLRNRLGLHARPAAALARTAAGFASRITVNGADARSVLALVGLNAVGGTELVVAASGADARRAVTAVVAELEEGFGEA